MRKLFLILSSIVVLSSCKDSDISLVKNGMLAFDKARAVGEVLHNWKSCKSKSWDEFESDDGFRVVEFSCEHKGATEFYSKVKSLLPKKKQSRANHLDIVSVRQTFQFIIDNYSSFEIDNVQQEIIWKDDRYSEAPQYPVDELKRAYNNYIAFNLSKVNKYNVYELSDEIEMTYKQSSRNWCHNELMLEIEYLDISTLLKCSKTALELILENITN